MAFSLETLKMQACSGEGVCREAALWLYRNVPLDVLAAAANEIRIRCCGDGADLCTIINAKSGCCSENCAFCAQSAHHQTAVTTYPLLDEQTVLKEAHYNSARGVGRFALVTAGRQLEDAEVAQLCKIVERLRAETPLSICVSAGLLNRAQFQALKRAGVTRIHNNLETSERHFPALCTTHTFADKIRAIRDAQAVGLSVCSGGIFGTGETDEDRIDMALSLRELGITSVPLNMLNPIAGTPLASQPLLSGDTLARIVAVYRFILPKAQLRLAGGRGRLDDFGNRTFLGGANAMITGDMLTTTGTTIESDLRMLKNFGFEVNHYE